MDCSAQTDRIVDSLPVMLAAHGHSYTARVAREVADAGYCTAKKCRFHGVRLHVVAARRPARLPLPEQIWLCEGSAHDSKAFIEQSPAVPTSELFGDLAYRAPDIISHLKEQGARLVTPKKKPKGGELTADEKYYNKLVRSLCASRLKVYSTGSLRKQVFRRQAACAQLMLCSRIAGAN
jgi:hypothetical protein